MVVKSGICENFYLAGGTAISIKYNHRYSEDFDFFSEKSFSAKLELLLHKLKEKAQLEVITLKEDTLIFYLNGVRLSFFKYPYKLLQPAKEFPKLFGVKIASDEDIAAMKAVAILQRGTKKDFFDLWFLMKKNRWPLQKVISLCTKKYGNLFPQHQFLKAAIYFRDAESENSFPEVEKSWKEVKEFFTKEVESILTSDK